MKASSIRPGFTVEVNMRGDVFPARVEGRNNGRFLITPLSAGRGWHSCTPRQVRRVLDPPGVAPGGVP